MGYSCACCAKCIGKCILKNQVAQALNSYQRFLVSELKYRFPNTFHTARASRNLNELAIKPPEKCQPAVAKKRTMNTGNGGPTRQDSYFLSPFMPKTAEMALPVPTKTFLSQSPDAAMLFAPFGCTHPPPRPLSCPFCLSADAEPISQGHCRM